MKSSEHNKSNEVFDSHAGNLFILLILQTARITIYSNTLRDNIFSKAIDPDLISSNLTATISDHLSQFAIISKMFDYSIRNKYRIHERDRCKFDWKSLILDFFSVDWEDLLKINELNVDN